MVRLLLHLLNDRLSTHAYFYPIRTCWQTLRIHQARVFKHINPYAQSIEKFDLFGNLRTFDLPDTLFQAPGSIIDPDPSPDMLRVQVSGRDKIVIWYYPLLLTNANAETIQHLSATIRGLVEAKAEYKRLPPARGGRI